MKVKTSKKFELSYEDSQVIDSLVHWLTRVRSRTDTIELVTLIRNSEVQLVRKGKKTILRFEMEDNFSEI